MREHLRPLTTIRYLRSKGADGIMPHPHSTHSPPSSLSDSLTAALARVDACPNACLNTEAPRAAVPIAQGWMASYVCADCGRAWMTSWRDD